MILSLLYWIILVLAVIGVFAPPTWPKINSFATIVLFVIIGLKIFRVVLA